MIYSMIYSMIPSWPTTRVSECGKR